MTPAPPPPPADDAPGSSQPPFLEHARTFWRGLTSTHGLDGAMSRVLEAFNTHVGARRTSVWLHDRRARELWLVASSDPVPRAAAARVPVAETDQPAARGLRLDQPQMVGSADTPTFIMPLRGWRRALGTLVVEGAGSGTTADHHRFDLAGEFGRQLSAGIENVQLLEDMLRQRRLLEDTFNSLVDLVVVTDRAHRVVQTNDAFARRLGQPRAELVERPLAELVGHELAEWTAADASAATERTRELQHPVLGGTFVATVTPLIDEDGEPVGSVLVARDITNQKRLEAEQDALRARLAQSEKLASLGQFVAGIAHEINNPLQGVLGHLELLMVAPESRAATPESTRALRRNLRRIYREADRAAKIVQNLLTFSGSQPKVRRKLRIERVLARTLASRRRALTRSRIDLVRTERDDAAAVLGDPLLLHQAILNVIINAEHAIAGTGAPGTITVSTATRNGRVIATVGDTGPGIPDDVLPKIFDPFFTTKGVGEGTGLGLAITYGIVQEHGGTIHAENRPGGGALFTIELPVAT
jgi:PAS domain S-box-containing protein